MDNQQFFIPANDLLQLIDQYKQQQPAGKPLLGFIFRQDTGLDGKVTIYPDALFSDQKEPTGDLTVEIINKAKETTACPYPPGYGSDNPRTGLRANDDVSNT